MQALFTPVTWFKARNNNVYETQDEAVQASIMDCVFNAGNSHDFSTLAHLTQEYDLLNAIHDQMIKLGYHGPEAGTEYRYYQEPVEMPASDNHPAAPERTSLEEARTCLVTLSGHKFAGLLDELDGTVSAANVAREQVLLDYAMNDHDDIDHLATVLEFIKGSINPPMTQAECKVSSESVNVTTVQEQQLWSHYAAIGGQSLEQIKQRTDYSYGKLWVELLDISNEELVGYWVPGRVFHPNIVKELDERLTLHLTRISVEGYARAIQRPLGTVQDVLVELGYKRRHEWKLLTHEQYRQLNQRFA